MLVPVSHHLCLTCGHVFSKEAWQAHHEDRGGHAGKEVRCTQCNGDRLGESIGQEEREVEGGSYRVN